MEPLGNGIDLPPPGTLPEKFEDEQQVIWASEYSEDGTGQFPLIAMQLKSLN